MHVTAGAHGYFEINFSAEKYEKSRRLHSCLHSTRGAAKPRASREQTKKYRKAQRKPEWRQDAPFIPEVVPFPSFVSAENPSNSFISRRYTRESNGRRERSGKTKRVRWRTERFFGILVIRDTAYISVRSSSPRIRERETRLRRFFLVLFTLESWLIPPADKVPNTLPSQETRRTLPGSLSGSWRILRLCDPWGYRCPGTDVRPVIRYTYSCKCICICIIVSCNCICMLRNARKARYM